MDVSRARAAQDGPARFLRTLTNARVASRLGSVEENDSPVERVARPTFILLVLPIFALIVGFFVFGPMFRMNMMEGPPPTWDRIALFVLRCAIYLAGIVSTALLAARELRGTRAAPRTRARGLKLTQLPVAAACPFCKSDLARADLREGIIRCADCGVVHHAVCWSDHGGCSTLGCARGPRACDERARVGS